MLITNKRPPPRRRAAEKPAVATAGAFPIAGIGASAGGLEAFSALLRHLPATSGIGFVLVQHLDPEHTSELVSLLKRGTVLPVTEIANDCRVEPNHVYVIPPNTSLRIAGGLLKLSGRRPGGSAHSIDEFFESLAADQHERAIGVVLSGTGADGSAGLGAIKSEGGITIAQDASAKFAAMPRNAEAAGCVDYVLSPEQIAAELTRIARHPVLARFHAEDDRAEAVRHQHDGSPLPSGGRGTPDLDLAQLHALQGPGPDRGTTDDDDNFRKVMALLQSHSGVDFSLYKSSTIRRRVLRRMVLERHHTLASYAAALAGNTKELDALYSDALISVTSFFRNPDSFDVLARRVWPELLKQPGADPLRVWVLGCSTGQEAYSIAMSYVEAAARASSRRRLQIFATDLNDALLDKARRGLYARSLAQDLSPERLQKFFIEEESGYRVSRSIREMVVFARQNVISDPPFSRLDMISCRNLLIFFAPNLQQQVLPMFHFALKPGGFLCLGTSESIGPFEELFRQIDKKQKVFARVASTRGVRIPKSTSSGAATAQPVRPPTRLGLRSARLDAPSDGSALGEADRVSALRFAPPGVLLDADLRIIQFRGSTSDYLEPAAGRASFQLLKMARPELLAPLRLAIAAARKSGQITIKRGVRVTGGERSRKIDLEIIPLKNAGQHYLLVLFHAAGNAAKAPAASRRSSAGQPHRRIADLEHDLAGTHDYLRSIQDQHEAVTEQLQSSNEEVQSSNEELQSLNEELQTSKEELESANEELETVNDEMAARNEALVKANADLRELQQHANAARDYAEAIIRTVRDPLLILDDQLTVLRANDAFYRTFKTAPEDTIGRVIFDLGSGQWGISRLRELLADILPRNSFFNDFEVTHDFPQIGRRTMLLNARRLVNDHDVVVGVLVGIQDITEVLQHQAAVRHTQARYQAVIEASSQVIWTTGADGLVIEDSASWRAFTGQSMAQFTGRGWVEAVHADDRPRIVRAWEAAMRDRRPLFTEFRIRRADGAWRWTEAHAVPVYGIDGLVREWVVTNTDITERRQAVEALREADRHKNEFLGMLAHELRNPLAPIRNAIEIVRQSLAAGSPPATLTAVTIMERQVQHVARLVEDLLDVSRVSRGAIQLRKEPADLGLLLSEAVDAAQVQFNGKHQSVELRLPREAVIIDGDPTRLLQIFGNLLHNASKFTGRNGRVEVSLGVDGAHPGDPQAIVRIADNGIGLGPGDVPRIFELFRQVDPLFERGTSGLGIGLTLVKTLVELHGGMIEARSEGADKGTEMVVRLPLPRPPVAAPPAGLSAR